MSSPIRQEDASGRHDVPSGRQCIVRKLSAIASGRDRVVSRSSYVRLCVATGASIGRQYVVKQIIWRCTGDALAIFDELAVVKTAPVGVKGARYISLADDYNGTFLSVKKSNRNVFGVVAWSLSLPIFC